VVHGILLARLGRAILSLDWYGFGQTTRGRT